MPDYLVEIEETILRTYKITAIDANDAATCVMESQQELEPVEQKRAVRVSRCEEVMD